MIQCGQGHDKVEMRNKTKKGNELMNSLTVIETVDRVPVGRGSVRPRVLAHENFYVGRDAGDTQQIVEGGAQNARDVRAVALLYRYAYVNKQEKFVIIQ